MARAICGVQLKDRKRAKDLILMLGLNGTVNHLAMANSVCMLMMGDGRVLRIGLRLLG